MEAFLLLDDFVIDEKLSVGSNDRFFRRCARSRSHYPQAEWEGYTRCSRGLDEFTAIERTARPTQGGLTHLFSEGCASAANIDNHFPRKRNAANDGAHDRNLQSGAS